MGSVYHEQNDGWPLGFHVRRFRLMENNTLTEPSAINTLIAASPSFSSDSSSSDLDTESTGSFFYDKSITLGNIIGVPSNLGMGVPTRVVDGQEHRSSEGPRGRKRNSRSRSWWCLCGSCLAENHDSSNMPPPSLGHFLEMERRASASNRRQKMTYLNIMYEEYNAGRATLETNALFADGEILPPHSADQFSSVNTDEDGNPPAWMPAEWFSGDADSRRSSERTPNHNHRRSLSLGSRVPIFFSGICGRRSMQL